MPGAEPSSEPADLQQQSPAQEQHLLSDQALSKSHHQQLQAAEEQQQLHEAEPLLVPAHQHQQAVLQQPVLALLSSGLPPIVLGTFQGDMQRARIILEAAGFLIPLDASSSLLPPGIAPCLPQQHAAPAVLHAEHAALRSNQTAVLASGHGDATVPGDEAAGMMPATADLQLTNVRQAASQGWLLACMFIMFRMSSTTGAVLCCAVLCCGAVDLADAAHTHMLICCTVHCNIANVH